MKIRPARTTDVFRLVELLHDQHAASRYAGWVNVDDKHARSMLARAVQRHGGQFDGSTLVNVVEDAKEVIQAFCVGALSRVYLIGDKLVAQDIFLCAGAAAPKRVAMQLLSLYVDWAGSNPNVFEINLSHTDALPTGERMGPIYEHMGFTRCGAIYRRDARPSDEREAA